MKILDIEINVTELRERLNTKFIPHSGIGLEDLQKALIFLEKAELAKKVNDENFIVYFRNTNAIIRSDNVKYKSDILCDLRETSFMIIERFCKKITGHEGKIGLDLEKEPEKDTITSKQLKLN